MPSFLKHAPFIALIACAYALPQPTINQHGPYVPPMVHIPQPIGPQSFGLPPSTILLNKDDLLTPGTILSGHPGSLQPRSTQALDERDIIGGVDNRVLQTKTGNPWDYIGNLARSDGGRCSGSLVGPRHLATARHCFDSTSSQLTYQFRPNYDQGTRGYTTASVTSVLQLSGTTDYGNPCSVGDDWAIMILDQRIGDQYGYFGVKQFDATKAGQTIFWNEGYPVDLGGTERPYVQQSITARNFTQCTGGALGALRTDADVTGGESGGPLWLLPEANGVRYLYGVCSSGSSTDTLFAGRIPFVNAVAKARTDFP